MNLAGFDIEFQLFLAKLKPNSVLFISMERDEYDFTNTGCKIVFLSDQGRYCLDTTKVCSTNLHCLFASILFKSTYTLVSWDIKQIVTYLSFQFMKDNKRHMDKLEIPRNILDLKYISYYMGNRQAKPQTYAEVLDRLKLVCKSDCWKNVYRKVHLPLAIRSIPHLESTGFLMDGMEDPYFSYYEIEGQVNGRIQTHKIGQNFLSIHSVTPEQRALIKPRSTVKEFHDRFIYLDFKNMEVVVLQVLTGDKNLSRILESGNDFYSSMFEMLFKEPCNSDAKRKFAKLIFLPCIFGIQAWELGKRINFDKDSAEQIIKKLRKEFHDAFDWLEANEELLRVNPIATDRFGRKRDFTGQPTYKRRNFDIQAPAALICLEKLNTLYERIGRHLTFHIHDGYVLTCTAAQEENLIKIAKESLESKSELLPDLRLQVDVKSGSSMVNLEKIQCN